MQRQPRHLLHGIGIRHRAHAACSLLDQCQKLFVPGFHFDRFDLSMDALGYVVAIASVLAVSAVV